MQRAAWTDKRLDDLSERVDAGFERVDRDIRDLRTDMNRGFAEARQDLRAEVVAVRADLGSDISELRTLMWRLNGGIFVAVVASILLRGI
jgi:hypothetical protein